MVGRNALYIQWNVIIGLEGVNNIQWNQWSSIRYGGNQLDALEFLRNAAI